MKLCSKCKESKESSNFNKQARAKDGLFPYCKSCCKIINQNRYKALEDKIIRQVKEWQVKNPEKVKAAKDKYRLKKNPPSIVI